MYILHPVKGCLTPQAGAKPRNHPIPRFAVQEISGLPRLFFQ
uniref:Uncharacterized protein n=1 Tax=Faecalibaculum rodentium TaxID=1702221 RepID=A0A140DU92_9FIRM|nr:hypothetical protein AALO17_10850 [Faecalibaculum rodentium]